MAFKLVRFVEDLIWQVCPKKDVKDFNKSKSTVSAKYNGIYYPAVLINEGSNKAMDILKKRYITHESVIKKYFRSIPVNSLQNTKKYKSRTVATQIENNMLIDNTVVVQQCNKQTQTTIEEQYKVLGAYPLKMNTCDLNSNKHCSVELDSHNSSIIKSDLQVTSQQSETEEFCENISEIVIDLVSNGTVAQNTELPSDNTLMISSELQSQQSSFEYETEEYCENISEMIDLVSNGTVAQNTELPSDNTLMISSESISQLSSLEYETEDYRDNIKEIIIDHKSPVNITQNTELLSESTLMISSESQPQLSSLENETEEYCENIKEIIDYVSPGNIAQKILATPKIVVSSNIIKKMHFCLYCKSMVLKFARHLEVKHRYEDKVSKFLQIPKGDANRLLIINEIRSEGTFLYNTDSTLNKGDMIVARRPQASKKRTANDYTACPKCKNFLKKNLLHRHYKRCGNIVSRRSLLGAPRNLQSLARATITEGTMNCHRLQNDILPGMFQDEVGVTLSHDRLILSYGSYLCQKHEGENHLNNMIRQKLRQLSQFLIHMRKIDPSVTTLESAIRPCKYDNFLKCVRICAGYNATDGTYRAPSLLNALGPSIKECAEKLVVECVKQGNENLKSLVETWLGLYGSEYSIVSRRANKIIARKKWNKPRLLPLTNDILKLNQYLKTTVQEARKLLKIGFDICSWVQLAKCTLLLVLIFNRKRVGEMEKLLIDDYNKKHSIQKESETYRNLKPSEQIFAQRYLRVEIRGKLGRPVALMVSHDEIDAIDTILKYRTDANVQYDNPYVFGRGINKYFEGAKCLREASNACGADEPALLRGTKLRKHIATVSQAMNFTENELAILADFMGHNIEIHRHFYRLPSEAIHLAKISQLLFALDTNTVDKYRGKTLNDINIDEIDIDDIVEFRDNEIDDISEHSTQMKETQIQLKTGDKDVNVIVNEHDNMDVEDIIDTTQKNTPEKDKLVNEISKDDNMDVEDILDTAQKNTPEKDKLRNGTIWTPNRKRTKTSRKSVERRPWQTPEKSAMRLYFKKHLANNRLPTMLECKDAMFKYSALNARSELQIKLWVSNAIKKNKLNSCSQNLASKFTIS